LRNGTTPASGIDFEPNTSADEMKRITVTDPVTRNNGGYGIAFGTDQLLKPSATKTVSATITNHLDSACGKISFAVPCYRRNSTTTGNLNIVNLDRKNPATGRRSNFG